MFIQSLAQVSLEQSTDKRTVHYNDLAEIVDSIDTLQFLQGKKKLLRFELYCLKTV